jgi:hypothetical protein
MVTQQPQPILYSVKLHRYISDIWLAAKERHPLPCGKATSLIAGSRELEKPNSSTVTATFGREAYTLPSPDHKSRKTASFAADANRYCSEVSMPRS